MIYTTSGYLDSVRVSPSGKEVAFLEHPVFDDDRGWVATIDEAGNHKQLTKEFETTQGLAWARGGSELWFSANGPATGADRQIYGVSLAGKEHQVLTAPHGTRLMDVAADGRVLLCSEELRSEILGIDPSTGKERRGLGWFNGSGLGDVSPDGKAILVFRMGRACRVVVPGGVPQIGWLRAYSAGRGRELRDFHRTERLRRRRSCPYRHN